LTLTSTLQLSTSLQDQRLQDLTAQARERAHALVEKDTLAHARQRGAGRIEAEDSMGFTSTVNGSTFSETHGGIFSAKGAGKVKSLQKNKKATTKSILGTDALVAAAVVAGAEIPRPGPGEYIGQTNWSAELENRWRDQGLTAASSTSGSNAIIKHHGCTGYPEYRMY